MKLEIEFAEFNALKSGFLLKKVMLGKCPKKGDHFLVFINDGETLSPENLMECQVYSKEMIGCAVPKAYRVIFGSYPQC